MGMTYIGDTNDEDPIIDTFHIGSTDVIVMEVNNSLVVTKKKGNRHEKTIATHYPLSVELKYGTKEIMIMDITGFAMAFISFVLFIISLFFDSLTGFGLFFLFASIGSLILFGIYSAIINRFYKDGYILIKTKEGHEITIKENIDEEKEETARLFWRLMEW